MRRLIRAISVAILSILVSVFLAVPATGADVNIVENPGFEEPLKANPTDEFDFDLYWTPKQFAWSTLTIVSTESHTGSHSLMVTDRAYWWASGYQLYFTFVAKETITCSAWVKVAPGGGEKYFRFGVFDRNGNDMPYIIGSPIEALCNDQGWTQITGTFRPAKEMAEAFIGVYFQPANEGEISWDGVFYIDDISITGSTGGRVPPPTPTPGPSTPTPTSGVTNTPTATPTSGATGQPTVTSGATPTSGGSTPEPTGEPSGEPTGEPSGEPTGEPTSAPTSGESTPTAGELTPAATESPTGAPTGEATPTTEPTGAGPTGFPWVPVVAGVAGLAVAAVVLVMVLRRKR